MSCSICGKKGHNSRSCPNKSNERNQAVWFKIDSLTTSESDKLLSEIITAKSKVAPKSRGTFAKGDANELPNKIKEALRLENKNEKKIGIILI